MRTAAHRFLRSGTTGGSRPADLAAECNRIVRLEAQRSLTAAASLARKFVRFSRRDTRFPLSVALRALGWVLHVGGKYSAAEEAYLEARRLMIRRPDDRAAIDRILADVYMYLGRPREAGRRARASIRIFEQHGNAVEAAKTRINLANLLHRQDRHREAYDQYSHAAGVLETQNNRVVLALCYYNQANTLVQLFDLDQARELYERAEKLLAERDYPLYVNECRYGLAWLEMLQGEYHRALKSLSDCEDAYKAASQPKGALLCRLDRSEVFLSLNLFSDARRLARQSELQANKLGIDYEAAKAAFFYARASFALGKDADARRALTRAADGFRRERNHGFLAALQLHAVVCGGVTETSLDELQVARRGFARAQLPLWEAMCDLQLLAAGSVGAPTLRRLARNKAVKTVPYLYAQWQTCLGDRAADNGRLTSARRHWGRAVEVLDTVRAKLPPVELGSAFLSGRSDPYHRLVDSHVDSEPDQAAAWAERHRTAGRWSAGALTPQERQRAEESLAVLAQQVASLTGRLDNEAGRRSSGTPRNTRALEHYRRLVRREMVNVQRLQDGYSSHNAVLIDSFSDLSRRRPIVQFHSIHGDILAFVHRGGETNVARYPDGCRRAREYLGCWRILLGRAMMSNGRSSGLDINDEHKVLSDIGDWLWAPLEIARDRAEVLVLPDGTTSNLPWQGLRHGGEALADRHDLILAPSLRHHLHAIEMQVTSEDIHLFVGDRDGLPHCRREVQNLIGSSAATTVHDPCLREDWPSSGDAWIWHYTGHAELRSDNPFYSSLILTDGPLFAADFRLKNSKVGLVTLAACRTGHQSVLPGEESTGLVRSLLEMGAKDVVGSHWAVSDRSTALWMSLFYDKIFDGESVAHAVRLAATEVREKYPSAYDWAAFSVFGAG